MCCNYCSRIKYEETSGFTRDIFFFGPLNRIRHWNQQCCVAVTFLCVQLNQDHAGCYFRSRSVQIIAPFPCSSYPSSPNQTSQDNQPLIVLLHGLVKDQGRRSVFQFKTGDFENERRGAPVCRGSGGNLPEYFEIQRLGIGISSLLYIPIVSKLACVFIKAVRVWVRSEITKNNKRIPSAILFPDSGSHYR